MNIPSLFSHFSLHVLIDFSIVLTLVLGLIYFLASGRLYNLLKLIGIVFCLYAISILFQFDFLYSILNQYSLFFFILIIILFQAELRHAFETLRQGSFINSLFASNIRDSSSAFSLLFVSQICVLKNGKSAINTGYVKPRRTARQ